MNEIADTNKVYDILVVGGGVNGAGIAADAAGRGMSVLLCEQGDIAGATSSRSSKLIHGGLRYLEHYEFKLVRDALAEREVLLKKAPHIMWPLRFRLPHQKHLRPAWMIRAGLFLYDNLAKREMLPGSRKVTNTPESPLVDSISTCFEYSDGWVDDARLVVLNAMQAQEKGADILIQTKCIAAEKQDNHWLVTLQTADAKPFQVKARSLVNAAGPWAAQFINDIVKSPQKKSMRLVKGSHIVVKKMYESDEAYILQNKDGRIVFAIPYEDDFTLVGTTDEDYQGDPSKVAISESETDYILEIANEYFKTKIQKSDIVHSFSGVRPLLEDSNASAQELSRDYQIKISGDAKSPVLVNIFGGKITTYRKLSEQAVNELCDTLKIRTQPWTKTAPFPGGNFENKSSLQQELRTEYDFVPRETIARWVRTYGTLCKRFLEDVKSISDLGTHFGSDLYQREVEYLIQYEWAQDAETVLWRRTKLGLSLSSEQVISLEAFISNALDNKVASGLELKDIQENKSFRTSQKLDSKNENSAEKLELES